MSHKNLSSIPMYFPIEQSIIQSVPKNLTKNEEIVIAELTTEWMLGSTLRDTLGISMHSINNALQRLLHRGLIERMENKELKRVMWRRHGG